MENEITLEARLKDKILSINNKDIRLDDSVFDAESFKKEGIDYLELKYKTNDGEISYNEAENIYLELETQNLKEIEVSPCPEGRDYQTVALFGKFNAQIYDAFGGVGK